MSLVVPLAQGGRAPLARRNPLAKIVAAAVLAITLLVTLDPVTPALLLAVEVLATPLLGIRPGPLLRRAAPLLVGAAGVALANVVGGGSLAGAGVVVLRLVAATLPGVLVLATIDPVDLADALVLRARLPVRFAYGTLAGLRLLPLLADDWHALARARRARGVDAGRDPVARVRIFAGQVFGLLVAAIRRAVRLAAAMDARGFDAAAGDRTYARTSPWSAADSALVVVAAGLAGAATAVSIRLGAWSFVLS